MVVLPLQQNFSEKILIKSLEVWCRIGVTEAERVSPQRLLLDIEITPLRKFADLHDRLDLTVDYSEVAIQVASLASQRPRNLIETLAFECANWILLHFPAASARVCVRKFILPNADFVAAETFVSLNSDAQ